MLDGLTNQLTTMETKSRFIKHPFNMCAAAARVGNMNDGCMKKKMNQWVIQQLQ
jgi:hypothetical protein